ncbi:MAG: hypothetical protein GPOALKHO_001200 [Sodalis sp.]|nr:MAG: hypothetical protein GPOALKHO_001200 [Sodalis sp.]
MTVADALYQRAAGWHYQRVRLDAWQWPRSISPETLRLLIGRDAGSRRR